MDPIRRRLVRLARGGLTAVSVEPLGAVARRGFGGRAGYEPLRAGEATSPGESYTRCTETEADVLRRAGLSCTHVPRVVGNGQLNRRRPIA